jgi:hypothetical protein
MKNVAKSTVVAEEARSAQIVTMTPEWASRLLATNTNNRSISKNAVAALARDMAAGNWRLNGDAIRIGADGELKDGQHRLTACVVADVPFQTLIMTGIDKDDQLTIDRGRPRNIGDTLTMTHGIQGGKAVSAAIRNLVIFARQDLAATPTAAEYVHLLELHPGIIESATTTLNSSPARPAILAAIHYVGSAVQREPERANAFVQVFKTGVPDYKGDAAHALREMLIKERAKGVRRADFKTYSLFSNMWEKFCAKTPVKSARSKDDFILRGWDEAALYKHE